MTVNFDIPTNVGGGPYATQINLALASLDELVVNVKAPLFGAAGDGATDDTTAIQEAIDAATTAGGGIVYFPPGEYLVDTLLFDAPNISLVGAGRFLSRIVGTPASDYLLRKSSVTPRSGIRIEGLGFDVTGATVSGCVRVQYVQDFTVRDCHFQSDGLWGMVIGAEATDAAIRNYQVLVENCSFAGDTDTYEQLLILQTAHMTVRDCRFSDIGAGGSGGIGLGIYAVNFNIAVENCNFLGTSSAWGKGSYYCIASQQVRYKNCRFESLLAGIEGANEDDNGHGATGRCLSLDVEGCFFTTGGTALRLGCVNGAQVRGNTFYRCHQSAIVITKTPVGSVNQNMAERISIVGNTFLENNFAGGPAPANPAIWVIVNSTFDVDLTIIGNTFADDQGTPTQYHWLACEATTAGFLVGKIVMSGNVGTLRSGGRTFTLSSANVGCYPSVKIYGNEDNVMDFTTHSPRLPLGNGVDIIMCAGSPEGVVGADPGSLALDEGGGGGSTLYVKESGTGNTGWVAK